MTSTSKDLQVVDLDLKDYLRGMVDCGVCCYEALEFVFFGSVVVEGEEDFVAVGIEILFPGIVGSGYARLPGIFCSNF
jgi:hypothetical protein